MVDGGEGALAIEWIEGDTIRRIVLPEVGTLRLGRDPEGDVVFDELSVSRHHARIACGPRGPVLRHVSRRSPTWLNGRLIIEEAPIGAGDVIRLSTVEMHIRRAAEL